MATLAKAIELAAKYHAGQVDKGGKPYILHPLAAMARVETAEQKIAAALHDIIEDTPITAEDLKRERFSDDVIDAVVALTKTKGMTRTEAAYQTKENPITRRVKLADLAENMDLSRIPEPTKHDYNRLKEYEKVKSILIS